MTLDVFLEPKYESLNYKSVSRTDGGISNDCVLVVSDSCVMREHQPVFCSYWHQGSTEITILRKYCQPLSILADLVYKVK